MRVAVLHQANPAPLKGGVIKPFKEGGYRDSSADIAFALLRKNVDVVTPVGKPVATQDEDWSFPDTMDEILALAHDRLDALWLNTVLHSDHPVVQLRGKNLGVIGQDPGMVDRFDDKFFTNRFLRKLGMPMVYALKMTLEEYLSSAGDLFYPHVLKPIRGRGSQGVAKVMDAAEGKKYIQDGGYLSRFGNAIMLEEFLPGREITVTVMPPGKFEIKSQVIRQEHPWCLPVVIREFQTAIAPYSGRQPVQANSRIWDTPDSEGLQRSLIRSCVQIGQLLEIRAPIRIDGREDKSGHFALFDINLKPNLTGNGRPGREKHDSLTTIAAEGLGWSYPDLIKNIANQSWIL